MTKDFIDDLFEVVEVKKTVKKSSNGYKATKAKSFELAGVEVQNVRIVSAETRGKISEGNKGKILSEETKRKMSDARRKRTVVSEETRKKLSEATKGRVLSEEHKKKISVAGKGRVFTKEHRKKIGEANRARSAELRRQIGDRNKGKVRSEETKRKLSEAHKGKVLSEEHKRKIGESGKGKVLSDEARRKISEKNKGKIRTEEQKKRMSEIAKLRERKNPIMTPNGEFVSRNALLRRLVDDGVRNPTEKLRTWLILYSNDYYYIGKKKNKLVNTIEGEFDTLLRLDKTVKKLLQIITLRHQEGNPLTVVRAILLKTIASKSTNHKNLALMAELGLIEKQFIGSDLKRKYLFPTKIAINYLKTDIRTQKRA